jgi:hypothetical protein
MRRRLFGEFGRIEALLWFEFCLSVRLDSNFQTFFDRYSSNIF